MPDPVETSSRTPAVYVVGEIVNERYEVLTILGSGAFSTVYRVFDSARGHECALKVFGPNFGLDVAQRELHALMNLRHPNVVEVIDVGQTSTRPSLWFLKSEFVDGELLSNFTEPGRQRLALPDALACVDQILDALQVIHPKTSRIEELKAQSELGETEYRELMQLQASGLIHRDIKPQNIIRSVDGTVKLLDFNIATPAGAAVLTTSGTPAYTPPEANLAAWDVSPDLFGVGVVLYELLTQVHPYPDRQPRPDIEPQNPSELNPDVSPALGELVCRLCGPRKDNRFGSALDARMALANTAAADAPTDEPSLANPADFVAAVLAAGQTNGQLKVVQVGSGAWSVVGSPDGYSLELHVSEKALAIELVAASQEYLQRLREGDKELAVLGEEPIRTATGARWLVPTSDTVAARAGLTARALAETLLIAVEIVEQGTTDETIPTMPIGELPDRHLHVGWITTPDIRLPFVVAELPNGEGIALSAMTASGTRRYPAPRGAYFWDRQGRALPFESVATAKWTIGQNSVPVVDAGVEGLVFGWRAPIPGLEDMGPMRAVVENRDGSAFVQVIGERTDRNEEPSAAERLRGPSDTAIERFLEARLASEGTAADVVRAFVVDASDLGLDWEIGKSSSSADGYGAYAIIRIRELGANGQLAFLWPASSWLDLRLDRDWARGRMFATPRESARANAFQVQVELRSEPARREAGELLKIAVRQAGGSAVLRQKH